MWFVACMKGEPYVKVPLDAGFRDSKERNFDLKNGERFGRQVEFTADD